MGARASSALAVVAALVVLVVCARSAAVLLAYPWDWSPDEGLVLDYARRLVEAPATLYGPAFIPSPSFYTPLLPALLAPIVGASDAPLTAARVVALAWTAAAGIAMFTLVRRKSGPALGAVAAALVLAPRDFSIWFVLVRFDGLMIALWLCAAAALLPARLAAGADRLSTARLATGAVFLLAAVLAKQTAIIHGAPLVLGWFLVDRRSAWRLAAATTAGGVTALAALQIATGGAFLSIQSLWGAHPARPGLLGSLVSIFVTANAAVLVLVLAAVAAAWRTGQRPLRDGAWLLVLGGLAILPALGKAGAFTNYLLPLYCALVVLACRLWPVEPPFAMLVPPTLALALMARPVALPTAADAATSAAFYSFVEQRGRPILATRPEYAYVVVRQPVEAEGSGLSYLVTAHAPGMEELLARVQRRHYRLIVALPYFWPNDRRYEAALGGAYQIVGTCALAFFYGRSEFILLVPRGEDARFAPPPGTRCRSFTGGADPPG